MRLLIPGPTPIPDSVREAIARPAIAHRSPVFESMYARCAERLSQVFRTDGPVLSIAGSGTTAFEAAQLSLARPDSTVVVCTSGKFGARWAEVYRRVLGVRMVVIDAPWGEPIDPNRLAETLRANGNVSIVTMVHSETSTATVSDLAKIASVVRAEAPDAILIADGITSVAAIPVETDGWDVDVVVSGSQKAFMLPPGLGFVSLGTRAIARLGEADRLAIPLSLDLAGYLKSHANGTTPFTPPISLFFGLEVVLELLLQEGLEAVWKRTRRLAEATRQSMVAMGLSIASSSPSDSVTVVYTPEGVGGSLREVLRREHGVLLADGQDHWKNKVVRMSHMGAVTEEDTVVAIEAIAASLQSLGAAGVDPDAGPTALRRALSTGSTRGV